jgi:GTP pyrophosphokinase
VLSFAKGASPVDFAYGIHSEVGHQCVGAKVGGRIVPLKYKLKSGDTVEILTNKGSKPNKDWLHLVATSRARNQIRSYLKKEERIKSMDVGREMLEFELKKFDINTNKFIKEGKFDECIKRYNQGNLDNMFANIGLGHLSVRQVASVVVPKEKWDAGPVPVREVQGPLERIFRRVSGGRPGTALRPRIKIGDAEDVMTTFAHCCNPLPGDPITGFVTVGKGVTVHTSDCPMVLASAEERKINVEWDHHTHKNLHTTKLKAVCVDRPGLLAKLSRAITLSGVNISEAQIRTLSDNKAVNVFTVTVHDLEQLKKLIQRMEEVEGVIAVERLKST